MARISASTAASFLSSATRSASWSAGETAAQPAHLVAGADTGEQRLGLPSPHPATGAPESAPATTGLRSSAKPHAYRDPPRQICRSACRGRRGHHSLVLGGGVPALAR